MTGDALRHPVDTGPEQRAALLPSSAPGAGTGHDCSAEVYWTAVGGR